jgi:predicted metal-binding membrane protein
MDTELAPWTAADFAYMFTMWSVMMAAMMLPSASPMILLHAGMNRQSRGGRGGSMGTAAFAGGYLLAWTGFSAVATALQWGLERLALLSPMMVSTSVWLGSVLLIGAGIYQFSAWKHTCLQHCRSPVQFLMQHWRTGVGGAFRMGLEHGIYCIGCCWMLMVLLFVGGVMNLAWIGVLAVIVLLEKTVPRGRLVAWASGAVFIGAGLFLLFGGRA